MSLLEPLYVLVVVWLAVLAFRIARSYWTSRVTNPTRRLVTSVAELGVMAAALAPILCLVSFFSLKVRAGAAHESRVLAIDAGYGKIGRGSDIVVMDWSQKPRQRVARRVVGVPGDPVKEEWGSFVEPTEPRDPVLVVPAEFVAVCPVGADETPKTVQIIPVSWIRGRIVITSRVFRF